jgi:hypothetical protein
MNPAQSLSDRFLLLSKSITITKTENVKPIEMYGQFRFCYKGSQYSVTAAKGRTFKRPRFARKIQIY